MGALIRLRLADRRCFVAPVILAGMLLCIPSVPGTEPTQTVCRVAYTTMSASTGRSRNFDPAKLQARARVVCVSSGEGSCARMVD